MSAELTAFFEYDLWANRRWAVYLSGRRWPEPESAIFRHILSASTIWLLRLEGDSPAAMPSPATDDPTMVDLHDKWLRVVTNRDLEEVIHYKRVNGEALSSRVGEIARHVANHATYHRGEIRGLCRAAGLDDFPETDYIRFSLERG